MAPAKPETSATRTTSRDKVISTTAAASRPKRTSLPMSKPDEPIVKRQKASSTGQAKASAKASRPEVIQSTHTVPSSSHPSILDRQTAVDSITPSQAHSNENDTRSYWLMKAEPESRLEQTANGTKVDVKFSIDDLRAKTDPEPWEGIRNPAAQKCLRAMSKGDLAFFYESNTKVPGIVGVMEIVRTASPDETAFDESSPYYDPKSKPESPRWQLVHVSFRQKFTDKIGLKTLQGFSKSGGPLENLQVFRQARLSVSHVEEAEWRFITSLLGDEDRAALATVEKGSDDGWDRS